MDWESMWRERLADSGKATGGWGWGVLWCAGVAVHAHGVVRQRSLRPRAAAACGFRSSSSSSSSSSSHLLTPPLIPPYTSLHLATPAHTCTHLHTRHRKTHPIPHMHATKPDRARLDDQRAARGTCGQPEGCGSSRVKGAAAAAAEALPGVFGLGVCACVHATSWL